MSKSVTDVSKITLYLDANKDKYIQISQAIHAKPEIGNQEFFASETLTELLKEARFQVEKGVAGHETAFYALKDSGKPGPRIAFLAEYDALPGIGHACGHNIIGTTSAAAGIALAETLDQTGGSIAVLGTPAEEGGPNGSAKGSFVKHGLLEDIDAALIIHPSGRTSVTGEFLAVDPLDFHFYGKPAHASGSPDKGINALDAVIQLFNGINALRQHLPQDIRIHGIIPNGGDAPNIVPEYASARFFIRAETWQKAQAVSDKVKNIAKGAALATGANVKIERFQNEVKDFVLNPVLDQVLKEELENVGEFVHLKKGKGRGSTDTGNISYEVPTAHPYIQIGPEELIGHSKEFREAARSEIGDAAVIKGAKALAHAGYRLLTDKELLQKAQETFEDAKSKKQAQ